MRTKRGRPPFPPVPGVGLNLNTGTNTKPCLYLRLGAHSGNGRIIAPDGAADIQRNAVVNFRIFRHDADFECKTSRPEVALGDVIVQSAAVHTPMKLQLRLLHPDFGAEILDVDLSQTVSDARFAEIEMAVEQYSVVLFRRQSLDDESQLAFSRRFGKLEYGHVAYGRDGSIEYIGHIGNIDAKDNQLSSKHKDVVFSTGNEMWHSDSSFREAPARFSISYAYEVTPEGGELEFVSTRPAYARLPPELKETIADLVVIHDYVYSRSKVGEDVVSPSLAESLPPVPQKLVRTNPATGAKNYYVGSHAQSIEGWNDEDAHALLDDLVARATNSEYRYQHRWQVGDLLIWDNRCVLHRGRPYDADRYRRRMHQTRVAGLCSSLDEDQFESKPSERR